MTQVLLAATLGLLYAVGTFLVLRRDVVRVVWGITIISQATNVFLVTMGGLAGTAPVLAGHGGESEGGAHAGASTAGAATGPVTTDPLVQALVLTAIVISFGTTAFALVLTYRVYQEHDTIDLEEFAVAPGAEATPDPDAAAGGDSGGETGGE